MQQRCRGRRDPIGRLAGLVEVYSAVQSPLGAYVSSTFVLLRYEGHRYGDGCAWRRDQTDSITVSGRGTGWAPIGPAKRQSEVRISGDDLVGNACLPRAVVRLTGIRGGSGIIGARSANMCRRELPFDLSEFLGKAPRHIFAGRRRCRERARFRRSHVRLQLF